MLAYEKMQYQAYVEIVTNIFVSFSVFVALYMGYSLIVIATLFIMGGIVKFCLSFAVLKKHFTVPKLLLDVPRILDMLKRAYPLGFALIFVMIYYRIDTVMLSLMKTERDVGIYNAAYMIFMGLAAIPSVILPAIFSNLSKFYYSSFSKLKNMYLYSLLFFICLGLLIAIAGYQLSDRLIIVLYGSEFSDSTIVLRYLFMAILMLFINNLNGVMLNSINMERMNMMAVGSVAFINIILNFLLIPDMSYEGAAIATLVSESLVMVFTSFIIFLFFLNSSFGVRNQRINIDN